MKKCIIMYLDCPSILCAIIKNVLQKIVVISNINFHSRLYYKYLECFHVNYKHDACFTLSVSNRVSFYAPRKNSGEHTVAALSVRPSVSPSVRPICVRPITSLFEVGFRNYFTEMTTMLRRRVARKFESLTLRSRSQRDLGAKSCPAHNFGI